jgi:periplasmic protein TonB
MSVQSIPSTQDPSRLGIAFVTALFLHGAAFAALTLWPSDETVTPPGEQEITIDLAPAMEEIVSVAPAEVSAQEASPEEAVQPQQVEEAETLPPEETIEDQPQEVAALPVPQPVTEAVVAVEALPVAPETALEKDAVVALPPAETVVAKPPEEKPALKPVKKPPPAKPVERKPAPRPTVAAQKQPPSDPRQGQASASRENTAGSAASADPNVLNRYVASLGAALRNRLRYPDIARNQGISGVATVRFTMDRSGQILGASLVRGAGHPVLDQAALAAARPGSSLPAAPDSLPQQTFTVSVPLRFNLR